MKTLTFITGNENKLKQVLLYLDYPVIHKQLDLIEIQSLDPHEIVEAKVKEAFRIVQDTVLVEDVSLTCTALGKLPGPLIKWFLQELGTEGLCRLLNSYANREATASVLYALYDGKKVVYFEGEWNGTIAMRPLGTFSFGWNPIFIPDGYTKTWAEMSVEDQKKTSMRKIALQKLEKYLKK